LSRIILVLMKRDCSSFIASTPSEYSSRTRLVNIKYDTMATAPVPKAAAPIKLIFCIPTVFDLVQELFKDI
jgi:hypothetical protein